MFFNYVEFCRSLAAALSGEVARPLKSFAEQQGRARKAAEAAVDRRAR